MRLLIAAAVVSLSLPSGGQAAPTGPELGAALAKGQIDPAGFDFGALRYTPGETLRFLGAQTAAQLTIAKAHDKPTYQAVLQSRTCLSPAERLTVAGFDSALLAPDTEHWSQEKTAADAAYARYTTARQTVLSGQPAPYPEFSADQAAVALAATAASPELKALYTRQAEDQLWRHAMVFGVAKTYAEGVGKSGAVWLNARITADGCAVDTANSVWLKETLKTVPWFDIKTYGKDADAAAWMLAQHADGDPALQTLALERMGQLAVIKQSNPANFAYLWDRVALAAGRPQRYGTQMRCIGKVWVPISPVEEPTKLDERRSWVGLPAEALYQRTGAKVCGGLG